MSKQITGWIFVAVQAVILIALIIGPARNDWPTPDVVRLVGMAFIVAGIGIGIVATLSLGTALTPTPVPTERGTLTTEGLYRFVRHPIYTGVLAIVVGLTIRSGSVLSLIIAVLAVAFFNAKAAWEEQRLVETYPGYEAYAARTPRFVPRPGRTGPA